MDEHNQPPQKPKKRKRLTVPHHFPHILDTKPGFLVGWIMYKLFSSVKYAPDVREKLRSAARTGTVVYTIKYRGRLDYLLYRYRFLQDRISAPKMAFDLNMIFWLPIRRVLAVIQYYVRYFFAHGKMPDPYTSGFYREEIKKGTPSLIFLVDEKGFARRFVKSLENPLVLLLEVQKEMDKPILLVPLTYVHELKVESDTPSLTDMFFGSVDRPGPLRKIFLFFHYYRRTFIDVGPIVNLQERISDQQSLESLIDSSRALTDELLEHISRQRRLILGPPTRTREQLREMVLDNLEIRPELESLAERMNKPKEFVRKKANGYFNEIAANYTSAYIHIWDYILGYLFKRIFEKIEVDPRDLSMIREAARQGTMVYVPCHRSHIDYLVLNYLLFLQRMHPPRIAAGSNLSFWPMGHIFRKSGAFFIRRTFRNNPLYETVFTHYVRKLLENGYPIEFFIEGGRSRSGKMIAPKLGFLSITLDTFLEGKCDNLLFIPSHIGYDHIMEEQYYIKEMSGKEKKGESLMQMIRARRFLRRRYGTVYVRFAEPISAREYFKDIPVDTMRKDEKREVYRRFSMHVVNAINSVTNVTPLTLVSAALSSLPYRGFPHSEVKEVMQLFTNYLQHMKAPLLDAVFDVDRCMEFGLSALRDRKVLEVLEEGDTDEEAFYTLDEEKLLTLEYYKNNIVHFFVPASYMATALLLTPHEEAMQESIEERVGFLGDLLKFEFIGEEEFSAQTFDRLIDFFEDMDFVTCKGMRPAREIKVSTVGLKFLPLWKQLIRAYLESYWTALHTLRTLNGRELGRRELMKKAKSTGIKFQQRGQLRHAGALSNLTFGNAFKLMEKKGIILVDRTKNEDVYSLAAEEEYIREIERRVKSFVLES